MIHRFFLLLLLIVLTACGGAAAPAPTGQRVIAAFKAAGLTVENVQPATPQADSPLPKSFQENLQFTVPRLGDKGGQLFVCDTKKNCDAIFAYFDALKALAGPYTYQSERGTVVIQLNSGMSADEAAKFAAAIKGL